MCMMLMTVTTTVTSTNVKAYGETKTVSKRWVKQKVNKKTKYVKLKKKVKKTIVKTTKKVKVYTYISRKILVERLQYYDK